MVKISKFTCEQNQDYCVTDNTNPRFNYIIESKENNVKISSIKLIVNNCEKKYLMVNKLYMMVIILNHLLNMKPN